MIDLENEERRVLSRARAELSPSLADRARVRRALQSTLASSAAAEGSSTGDAPSALPGNSHAAGGQLGKWLGRLLVPVAATLGAGVGYELGYSAGAEDSRDRGVASAPSAKVESPAARPAPERPARVSTSASPPVERSPIAVTQPRAPARAAPLAPNASPEILPEAGLDEEVRLLRRVEQALRSDNARFALALLDELDQKVPSGQLVEERRAARVMALCHVDGSGAARAEKYASEYPSSAYLARVREACARAPAEGEP